MTRRGRRAALLALALPALVAAACGRAPRPAGDAPDVVLVTIDTLRPDFLGFLGFPREPAPFLARLAERSVVCEEARSTSSWTAPATASLLTGTYPDRHGLVRGLFAQHKVGAKTEEVLALRPIRGSLSTLAALLAAEGYRTFGLSANPNVDAVLGFARGFERFECRPRASAGELVDQAIEWGPELSAPGPSLLYLHVNDVHSPYEPRAPWYEPAPGAPVDPREAYLSEISYVDAQLARLFERFDWEREAVVMVVSDHGEEFGEHGGEGHGFSLHGELTRVLMIFRAPGAGFSPARVTAPASLIDALPTLLELCGLEPPREVDGRSLAALGDARRRQALSAELAGRTLLAHRSNYVGTRSLWSATDGQWKRIEEDGGVPRLYDLRVDRGEAFPLNVAPAQVGERLGAALRELRRRTRSLADDDETTDVVIDEALQQELRRLGYFEGR